MVSVVEAGIDTSFAADTFAGIRYIYNRYPDGQVGQLSTAVHYFLSKRTDLYASVNLAHRHSPRQPAGIFLIVNPATNVGYSTSRNQIALRVGLRSKF